MVPSSRTMGVFLAFDVTCPRIEDFVTEAAVIPEVIDAADNAGETPIGFRFIKEAFGDGENSAPLE